MMKYLVLFFVIVISINSGNGQSLELNQIIQLAQEQSLEYKVAYNKYQSNSWRYKNFKSYFLPFLNLSGQVPNYNRAISRITLPTGEDTFVLQNQAYSSLVLGINQNIGLTGGIVSINSSINRLDIFGNNRQILYATVPLNISYSQQAIGYNEFKWLKLMEPLYYELSDKQFVVDMEQIAEQTVNYFFEVIISQSHLQLSRQNLASSDTLYQLAQDRFRLGTVSQSELLQLRLNTLNANNQVRQDSVNLVLSKQQFVRFVLLKDSNFTFTIPENTEFFPISFDEALLLAKQNSEKFIKFKLQRLDAEQKVAKARAENNLKFNLQANFGLTNSSQRLSGLYNGLDNQQQFSIGFTMPIVDWGYSKTQKQKTEADLLVTESQIEQQQMQLEHEIALSISQWNLHKQQLAVTSEAKEIALQNYDLEVQRFLRGSISINDLNLAQNQKDNAINNYLNALKTYWELYFSLRKLTLYDFKLGKEISYKIQTN